MIRQPAVAGQFYPADPDALRSEVARLIKHARIKENVSGVIAPHAGYIYSGSCAGILYGSINIPRVVIILAPNHHGIGEAAALYPEGEWLTPLGLTPVSLQLSELLLQNASFLRVDYAAHLHEHSIEVQLPFLQYLRPDLEIVPICLGFGDYYSCCQLGEVIAKALSRFPGDVLIVASSDMTHYESAAEARIKDEIALDQAINMDPEGLLKVCRSKGISMCGVIPATVMLIAAKSLGATRARVVSYTNSGDVNGDFSQVVGYAGLTVV